MKRNHMEHIIRKQKKLVFTGKSNKNRSFLASFGYKVLTTEHTIMQPCVVCNMQILNAMNQSKKLVNVYEMSNNVILNII